MHAHAHKHTHVLRREDVMAFNFSGEMHGRKGKLVLHNPDREVHPNAKHFKHINSHIVFIREKKRMEERGETARIKFLNALLPSDGAALAKRKN